jgi:hypothetical protein
MKGKVHCLHFTARSGAQQAFIYNVFLGPIPEGILTALVKNTAFVGSASRNPYHFQHYITNLVFYENGVQHACEPFTVDCSSPFGVNRAYEKLFSNTGIHRYMITLEMFTKGFCIVDFDLTPDREADEEHISLPRQGNLRIEDRFNKPLTVPVTCIWYADFPKHVERDKSRKVTV